MCCYFREEEKKKVDDINQMATSISRDFVLNEHHIFKFDDILNEEEKIKQNPII